MRSRKKPRNSDKQVNAVRTLGWYSYVAVICRADYNTNMSVRFLGVPLTEVQGRVQIQYGCKPSPLFRDDPIIEEGGGEARALPGFGESAYGRLFPTRDLAC